MVGAVGPDSGPTNPTLSTFCSRGTVVVVVVLVVCCVVVDVDVEVVVLDCCPALLQPKKTTDNATNTATNDIALHPIPFFIMSSLQNLKR